MWIRVLLWAVVLLLVRLIGTFPMEVFHHKNEDGHPFPLVDSQVVPQFIIDCDPAGMIATGLDVDDDLALINAISLHQQGSIRIVGITITGGNAPVDLTYRNALELIRRRAGIHESAMGIYKGGLSLSSTPTSTLPTHQPSDAPLFLIDTIMNSPEQSITVLCLGPLTNIAAAYTMEPRIAQRVQRIVSMGGTLSPNLPHDLNIRTDPLAAAIVWNDMDCPKTILPVETCVQAVFGPRPLKHVEEACFGTKKEAIICLYWTRLAAQRHIMPWLVNRRYAGTPGQHVSTFIAQGFILWDLVALWAAIRPDLFTNWTYWDVKLMTNEKTSFFGRQELRVRFDSVESTINNASKITKDQPENLHRVLVPMILRSDNDLLELVLNHLFLFDESSVVVSEPLLSFHQSLGTLAMHIFTGVSLVLSSMLCFCCLRRRVR